MYEEIKRERNNGGGQINNEGIHVQMKPQFRNMPRTLSQDVRVSNIIQCSKWRYMGDKKWRYMGDKKWKEVDRGNIYSPPPNAVETKCILANTPSEQHSEIIQDTATIDYLLFCAELYWHSYGSEVRNRTYHSPNTTTLVPDGSSSKLLCMYRGKQNQGVRGMRKYTEEEKIHRYLRWLSTTLMNVYDLESEVQCYYDRSQNRILVSVNTKSDLMKLAGTQPREPLLCNQSLDIRGLTERGIMTFSRIMRHERQMAAMDGVFNEERGIPIHFLPPDEIDDMHAEQRILRYLQDRSQEEIIAMVDAQAVKRENNEAMPRESLRLDPRFLGGLRRCCLACARACFTEEDYNSYKRGPLWVSQSALGHLRPVDIVNIIKAIRRGDATYVTESLGLLTFDFDSDSEPDN